MEILKSFTPGNLELSVAELSRKVNMPKSTTYRLLKTLSQGGFTEYVRNTRKFHIGTALYTLGSLYLSTTDVLKAANPVIQTINELTSEAVNIAILEGQYITIIQKVEAKHDLRWNTHIGYSTPAYASAIGKALLSELTDEEIDALFTEEKLKPVTESTIVSKTELRRQLKTIRRTGFGFQKKESVEGIEAVGCVIRDYTGKAVAGVSIAVPMFRMNKNRREKLTALIKMGSDLISYRLGYQYKNKLLRDIQQMHSWWERAN